jgi:hypothetical protein
MMDLSQVSTELERLLEDCGIDEGWSDWLREFTDHIEHMAHTESEAERARLRHEILHYEQSVVGLSRYLPADDGKGACVQQKLAALLKTLDENVSLELWQNS